MNDTIVIVGAGHAGGTAAALLRQNGHCGKIILFGDENAPPYQRPPLSKAYLLGTLDRERLFLKPEAFYAQQDIELRMGVSARSLDLAQHTLTLSDGHTTNFDKLVIATGARPRVLPVPGAGFDGVQVLRTLADIDALRPRLTAGKRLVVVGAGYIGLEAAAAARSLDVAVTVLEAQARVLARVTGPEISTFYEAQHRAHGVDLRLQSQLSSFTGDAGKLTGVQLASGEVLPADIALVGVGVVANVEFARDAGLRCTDGIVVNADTCTSHPEVYAIGDCTVRPVGPDRTGRLESVHNALEQARTVAAVLTGKPLPKADTPWFWSDQYDLKLQTVGLFNEFDQAIVRGDPSACKFAVYYLKGHQLQAVDAVNSPQDFLAGKRLVGTGKALDPAALADPASDPKTY